ncbi:MFS transporter [Deinococcus detaillensis]|uniref:MFS transporter n=1 Tax=Deinococcus detaillensis TaxID=2592048 RepID=A0A553V4F6_9DEIO|nr:MFS transporter [Deinococcus detaillensis]TSA87370.1 MFS transporter [Deinococcus detaillensis]
MPEIDPAEAQNYRWGIVNGFLASTGDGFFNASVVLAGFAARLGASNAVIGLLPAIAQGGWMLPQILVAAKVRALPYKLPVYRSSASVRIGSYLAMVLITAFLWESPALCLSLFIATMSVNALASGVSGLPFLEVVSKTVPPQRRAAYFGLRNLGGGLLAFAAGLIVRWILGSGLAFPYTYVLIFSLATVAYTIAYTAFGKVQEPPDEVQPVSDIRQELRAIPQLLRLDAHFRAFLSVRLILAFASMADPFYTVYALRELQVPSSMLGVFLMTITGVAPLSNLLWRSVAERKGSRRIIRYSAAAAFLAPLIALGLGWWFGPSHAGSEISSAARESQVGWLYLAVFVMSSVAAQGFNLGHTNHLLNISPPHSRSRYIGTLNTLVGLALFAPVLGGVIADQTSYSVVFWLSAALFAAAWWQCGKLRRDA